MTKIATITAATAVPISTVDAIAVPTATATPTLPEWQQYICEITTDLHPRGQRFLRTAAETVSHRQHNPEPFEPGPIEELLNEYRRRNEIVTDRLGKTEDIGDAELDWLDEPLLEAMDFMPDSQREFAAFFVLVHLDDAIMADNHAARIFDKCDAMLKSERS